MQQKKKKSAIRFKPSKITVLAVDASAGVPKGKYRKQLKKNGCEKVVELKRNNSSQEVKNTIIRAFGFASYSILNCTPDGKFVIAKNSLPSGDEVIECITKKKFPLYIQKVCVLSLRRHALCY